jgi:hypothetical protein
MKGLATFVLLLVGIASPANAQLPCRPPTLPMPGTPVPAGPAFHVFVDETGHQAVPIPFLVYLGDVVLVEGDQALADQQSCLYYNQGQIDPRTWSDVLHIDNNPEAGHGEATLYSDCEPNDPNDPCLPPYEIDFRTAYKGAAELANPVFIPESSTGPTPYYPVPGAPYQYVVDSDPVEPPGPGCPQGAGAFTFDLYEDCHAVKINDAGVVETLPCTLQDPQTGCPAFQLDGTVAFNPGWIRLHEGAASAPVSDVLHFFGNHFVSFCSDPPDTPGEPPEASDIGIPPIPPGEPVVDVIEDVVPTVYHCGTATYQIFSDPPEPTAVPRTTWGKLKTLYR